MSAKRKNSIHRQVRRAYRQDDLARVLTMPEENFGGVFGMKTTEVDQRAWSWSSKKGSQPEPRDYYHFRDNGSSVLAVAHLDTVVDAKGRVPKFYDTQNGPAVQSGALDDRLGAYVILKLLPKLGVTCDWLLTVGEESGQSTASFFEPAKDYDHVIEFDRAGTDVVMYQYDDKDVRQAVRESGAVVGNGSFSDICYLEQLRVKAFNWGVGYGGNYHSEKGYAVLPDTFSMVAKYLRFHAQNAGIAMPHAPEFREYDGFHRRAGDTRYERYSDVGCDCDICGSAGTVDMDTMVCRECHCCFDCSRDELYCSCFAAMDAAMAKDEAEYQRVMSVRADTADEATTYEEWLKAHSTEAQLVNDKADA